MDEDLYLNGRTRWARVLRFLNLLEPGRTVLSISKIFMWLSLGILLYVLLERPEDMVAVLSAVGAQLVAVGNYVYRRHDQYLREKGIAPDKD